ncbi:MAG: Twitching motility protein, partial [Methylococcaceae bacterium NSP1-2]
MSKPVNTIDLKPYLKLMLEKKADNLSLKVGSPIMLCLAGDKKPLGKAELTEAMTDQIAFSLLTEKQKNTLINSSKLTIDYVTPDNEYFNVRIEVEENGLSLTIRPCTSDEIQFTKDNKPIEVLGKAPAGDLNIMPYLKKIIELNASDLFLTVDSPVKAKIFGKVVKLDDFLLTPELTKSATLSIMTQEQIDEFQSTKDLDFAIAMPDGSARFRANAFYQRRTVGLVMRLIPSVIPTAEELGLPEILLELIMAKRGLLLMVGSTGSGKSTTLAAMINHRNANSAGHILTIEDPVEFSHPNIMSIMNQREVGVDTASYAKALKASLREAPDVILIGEIRDRETMEAALELANTGHL